MVEKTKPETKPEGDADAVKQQELQRKYVEYQMMEQQIKQMQQQLEKLEQQGMEAAAVEQCIVDVGNTSKGDEVLVPVTGGVFFKTKVEDSQTFLVNVGGGVVVEKDVKGTRQLIQKQSEEIVKYKEHLTKQLAEKITAFQEMEIALKKLIED